MTVMAKRVDAARGEETDGNMCLRSSLYLFFKFIGTYFPEHIYGRFFGVILEDNFIAFFVKV